MGNVVGGMVCALNCFGVEASTQYFLFGLVIIHMLELWEVVGVWYLICILWFGYCSSRHLIFDLLVVWHVLIHMLQVGDLVGSVLDLAIGCW